jgi:hypothetical protein
MVPSSGEKFLLRTPRAHSLISNRSRILWLENPQNKGVPPGPGGQCSISPSRPAERVSVNPC